MTTEEPMLENINGASADLDLKRKLAPTSDDGHAATDDDDAHDEEASDAIAAPPKKQRKPRAKKQKFDATFHAGDEAPNVTVMDDTGEQVAFRSILENKRVIVFVFPKANTPGCTTQAIGFRTHYDAFKQAGFEVYGISPDNLKPQQNWKKKHNIQYTLLCDPEGQALKPMGLWRDPKSAIRSHIVFDNCKAVDVVFQTTPRNSIDSALKFAGIKTDGAMSKSASETSSHNDPNLSESAEQIAAELLSVGPVAEMVEAEAVLAAASVLPIITQKPDDGDLLAAEIMHNESVEESQA